VGRCLNQGEARDPEIRVFEAKSLPYAGGEFVGVDGGHSSCDAAGAEAASECHCRQHVRSIRGGMGGSMAFGPSRTAARCSRLRFSVQLWRNLGWESSSVVGSESDQQEPHQQDCPGLRGAKGHRRRTHGVENGDLPQ
jgi:hypothetical protein